MNLRSTVSKWRENILSKGNTREIKGDRGTLTN